MDTSLLVIDAENIRIREEELLIIKTLHRIDKILIYLDMQKNNICQHYMSWIYKYNAFFIHVPSLTNKNSVDLKISIDMTEMAIKQHRLKKIFIASNDKDFIPLYLFLKKYKKKVYIIAYNEACKDICKYIKNLIILTQFDRELKTIISFFLKLNQKEMDENILTDFAQKKKMDLYLILKKYKYIFLHTQDKISLNFF
jgi:hypothetical protein